jgi:uncharacterized protein (DUF2236 family)
VRPAPEFDPRDYLDGIAAVLAGVANVIMQLAQPPVGYGVLESKVESGQVLRHPAHRFRTTFTYLSVALLGSDAERRIYRDAVNGSHRLVRSDADSPVRYNAFDPELQLWVAACLYYGFDDVVTKLRGPLPDDEADALYRYAARLGTTLQVRPEMWPADRAAFWAYWERKLTTVRIDPPVRDYLHKLVAQGQLPRWLRMGRLSRFVTTGFLPQQFRDEMRLPWTPADQRRFDVMLRRLAIALRFVPGPLRRVPFNLLLWDLRLRIRLGRRIV